MGRTEPASKPPAATEEAGGEARRAMLDRVAVAIRAAAPIDPDLLPPEQRELWDKYMTTPLPADVSQGWAEQEFRHILALAGIPFTEGQ